MKIIIDAFGGDNAPQEIIRGAVDALKTVPDLSLVLTGDEAAIKNELSKHDYPQTRLEIIHAPEIITNEESPTMAIRQKKNSSLVVALNRLKEDDQAVAFVSAGSTGAVLAGGTFLVGRIEGILRPALAPLLPTLPGGRALMIDVGANVDSKPMFLAQFAILGVSYMQSVLGIENPRVALLSNGTEDKKGNELTHQAFKLLKEMPINFLGNIEAREILSGDYDVIVTDGFAGNVALKAIEGTAAVIMKKMKNTIKNASLKGKIGGALLKSTLKKMGKEFDYHEFGGAPFLGVNKLILKSHGSSNAHNIAVSIRVAHEMSKKGLIENIKKNMDASREILEKLKTVE